MVSAESLEIVEIYWQIKPLFFSSHQDLDSPKISKKTITFGLSRHPKSSSTAITGFMSSTKVAVKKIFAFEEY